MDGDHLDLDLFKGHHYDRALAELNLQPRKQSPEKKKIVTSWAATQEKPEIVPPIDESRYNPIQEAVLVFNPCDVAADMSCGNWEKSPTERIGSNSILSTGTPSLSSYLGQKLCFLQRQRQEWDRISSHSSVKQIKLVRICSDE